MPGAHKVVFFYDTVSPWSYVAFQVLRRYRNDWNLDVSFRPINLGYVMKFSGNRPPISVENKGRWMFNDMALASKFFDVMLSQPSSFPVNTSGPQSLLRLIQDEHPSKLEATTELVFQAIWHRDAPIKTADDLRAIFSASPDGKPLFEKEELDKMLEKSGTKEFRNKLTEEAEQLVKDGCFGMPWMQITRASDGATTNWWGSDRWEVLASWLGDVEWKGPRADGHRPRL